MSDTVTDGLVLNVGTDLLGVAPGATVSWINVEEGFEFPRGSGLEKIVLHLKGDEPRNTNLFSDISPNPKNILYYRNEDYPRISTTRRIGPGAMEFDGSSYIDVYGGSEFKFDGDFTIDGWVYLKPAQVKNDPWAGGYQTIFELGDYRDGVLFRYGNGTYTNNFYVNNVNFGDIIPKFVVYQWHHFAITRESSTVRLFIDGKQVYSGEVSGTVNSAEGPLRIGKSLHVDGQFSTEMVIDDFRIVKDRALYTRDFKIFDMLCPDHKLFERTLQPRRKVSLTDTIQITYKVYKISSGSCKMSSDPMHDLYFEYSVDKDSWTPLDVVSYDDVPDDEWVTRVVPIFQKTKIKKQVYLRFRHPIRRLEEIVSPGSQDMWAVTGLELETINYKIKFSEPLVGVVHVVCDTVMEPPRRATKIDVMNIQSMRNFEHTFTPARWAPGGFMTGNVSLVDGNVIPKGGNIFVGPVLPDDEGPLATPNYVSSDGVNSLGYYNTRIKYRVGDSQYSEIMILSQPQHGYARVIEDRKSMAYMPFPDFKGIDSYTYTLLTQHGQAGLPKSVYIEVLDQDSTIVPPSDTGLFPRTWPPLGWQPPEPPPPPPPPEPPEPPPPPELAEFDIPDILVHESTPNGAVWKIYALNDSAIGLPLKIDFTPGSMTANEDFRYGLTYSIDDGLTWEVYNAANPPAVESIDIPLKVRLPILDDAKTEPKETGSLIVTYTDTDGSKQLISSQITMDDGRGSKFNERGDPI